MNKLFHAYAPFKGEIAGRRTGVLISNARARLPPTRSSTCRTAAPFMIGRRRASTRA